MDCILKCNNTENEVIIDEATGLPKKPLDFAEKPSVIYKPNTVVPQNSILEIPAPKDLECPITFFPTVDTFFDADHAKLVILMELPGFSSQDIDVRVGEGELYVAGPRPKEELYDKFGSNLDIHIRERKVGYFYRRFKLPHNALDNTTVAKYENGILDIRIECSQFGEMRRLMVESKS
ncbi:bifunctional Alpha crystallin-Hsp20 domain/HSP20-like chaperone [Babesia duncani]|uniref:Bifunctional Alpha crystallin-Hsp20 domain/HSP20-like chaperone n=1 Tax=Babesia duncani TaxID=323732 RepID=A0AAD9PNA6_9APIC|nr:bifunctional Alpha crystallin-Hsp20 domain/HSP20-like chaperone [Babesia duncani]